MKKYILDTINRLNAFIQGMEANPGDWTDQPVKLVDVQASSTLLTQKGEAMDTADAAAIVARHDGSEQNTSSKNLLSQAETFAYAIYANRAGQTIAVRFKTQKRAGKSSSARAIYSQSYLKTIVMRKGL